MILYRFFKYFFEVNISELTLGNLRIRLINLIRCRSLLYISNRYNIRSLSTLLVIFLQQLYKTSAAVAAIELLACLGDSFVLVHHDLSGHFSDRNFVFDTGGVHPI